MSRRKRNRYDRTEKDIKMDHMGHDNTYESIEYFQKDTYEGNYLLYLQSLYKEALYLILIWRSRKRCIPYILGISLPSRDNDYTNNFQSKINVIVSVKVNLASRLEKVNDQEPFVNEYKVCTPHMVCQKQFIVIQFDTIILLMKI